MRKKLIASLIYDFKALSKRLGNSLGLRLQLGVFDKNNNFIPKDEMLFRGKLQAKKEIRSVPTVKNLRDLEVLF